MARRRRSAFRQRREFHLAYGSNARPLGDAILALLPPPTPGDAPCNTCRGDPAGCLACRRSDHLLQAGDPVGYRRLVTRAVCAVQKPVPIPPPRYTPGNSGFSQAQFVRKVIDLIRKYGYHGRYSAKNVLCQSQGDLASKLVTSPSWVILLERIGDMLMCYILMHSSIFLPVRKSAYLQVTGRPLDTILYQSRTVEKKKSTSVEASCDTCAVWRKNISDGNPVIISSSDSTTQNPKKRKRLYSWQRRNKQKHKQGSEDSSDINIPQIKETCNVPVFSIPQSRPICFNCLMSNASKCVSLDSLIPRNGIFYNNRISKNVFHHNNLDKWKRADALSLIKHIFGIKDCCIKVYHCGCNGSSTRNSNCLCHRTLQLVNNLIRNSKRCQYNKLFMKHCSAKSKAAEDGFPSANVTKKEGPMQYSMGGKSAYCDGSFAQLEAYSTHQQVESFVWAVLTRIIPKPLLLYPSTLRTNIGKFIRLRRYETFQVTDCIGELKVSSYSWLSQIGSTGCSCSVPPRTNTELPTDMEEQKQNLLHCWISWLFSDIVIPLISTYFYVTERETKRYDVFYYPKSVWRNLTSNAIALKKESNGIKFFDEKKFSTDRGKSRSEIRKLFGFSRVRFLPKTKDMRLLVNLKAQSKDAILSRCHLVIKKMRDENPEIFGSSVFDYDSIHKNLSSFLSSVRRQWKEPEIYIVVADVSKAFDCVKHDKLLDIMNKVLKDDEYVLRKCTKTIHGRSKNLTYRFDSNVSVSNGNNIHDFLIQPSSSGGILVDKGPVTIQKKELHNVLSQQVEDNVMKIGKNFYLQTVGISQGNKLSTLLCSLYYADLEKSTLLKCLDDKKIKPGDAVSVPEYLLMRFTDDFVFISSSKELASNFFNRIRRGFVYYNSYMNERKYGFNFNPGVNENFHNRLYKSEDGVAFIPWCGLLINSENLEIQADYTRYSDITIMSTITVNLHSSMKCLGKKLCHYASLKCHPIFYDSNINSPGTIRLNIYQACLLCAMKFHCYIRSLPYSRMSKPKVLRIINRTFRHMYSCLITRMQDMRLRRNETTWLGLSAYIRVLQKKQSFHKDLLALLITEAGRYVDIARGSDSLRYAVDDSHSSMFWKFRY